MSILSFIRQTFTTYRGWDIFIKFLTVVILIFGIAYSREALSNINKSRFWEERFKTYSELLETTSTIATSSPESETFINAKNKFEQLYYGKSQLIETEDVKKGLANFMDFLKKHSSISNMDQTELKILSMDIADECHKSLSDSNGIDD